MTPPPTSLLRRRSFLAAMVLVGAILVSLGVAWLTMGTTRSGPAEVRFEAAAITIDGQQLNVLEGNFLAKAVMGVTGNATDLAFTGCDSVCTGAVTGASLRAKDSTQPLGLSSVAWIAPECGPTTLSLRQGWDGFAGRLSREKGACTSTLRVTLSPGVVRDLSFNPMPKAPPADLAGVTWKTSEPLELRLRPVTGPLLHRDAAAQVTSVVGKLSEPLPRLAGETSRSHCAADKGDTVRFEADAWELSDFTLAGSLVTVQATSKHKGLSRCTGPIKDRLASCTVTAEGCRFDLDELWKRTGLPGLIGFITLVTTLLAFRLASPSPAPSAPPSPPPSPTEPPP